MPFRRLGYRHEQLGPFNVRITEPQPLVQAAMSGGMITSVDPADIPNENVQLARNMLIRMDKLARRPGSSFLVRPAANPVSKYITVKSSNGTVNKLAFVGTEVYDVTVAPALIPAAIPLTHGLNDRIRTAYVLNTLAFTNNGVDPIQSINFSIPQVGPLGNAPEYRYITGMFNRVVGAARAGVNEIEVGWSAEYPLLHEWNPLVEETAGSSPIIETPDDISDHITGIFGFANSGILLREGSLWGITKQPIPQNPFHFYSAFSGLGCDTPNSAIRTRGGVTFLDRKSGCVWDYRLNEAPVPIGQVVEDEIMGMVTDPADVFGGYSFIRDEYNLAIPIQNSDIVYVWTYSFKYKQWTYESRRLLSSIDEVNTSTGGATIDQLGETPIDELVGNIDDLSAAVVSTTKKIFGEMGGHITHEDPSRSVDSVANEDEPYESEIISKVVNIPRMYASVNGIRVEFEMSAPGDLTLEYSKDNINWRTLKTITPTQFNVPLELMYSKPIRARRIAFRVRGSNGSWELLGYSIDVKPSGKSKPTP